MKRRLVFFLLLLGGIASIAVVVKLLTSRSPKQGELRIEATPVVSVFLDNKHLGRTPVREKVNAGAYTLKLTPESPTADVAGWQGNITLGQNLLTFVNATLAPSELSSAVDILWLEKIASRRSELSVVSNPDGATVMVDEVTRGVTPITIEDVMPGEHSLTVTSPGFLTRTVKIRLTPGYKLVASLKLALTGVAPTPEATPTAAAGPLTPTPKTTPTKTATSSATIPDPPKPFVIIKDTPTGFLRVRMEPTTAATEAARVNPGEKYTILEETSGWYQIKYDGKNTGWISGQYADKVE